MWKYNPADPDEYLGNMWGWRFSAFGAVLLVGLIALAVAVARSRNLSLADAVREARVPVGTGLHPDSLRADSFMFNIRPNVVVPQ